MVQSNTLDQHLSAILFEVCGLVGTPYEQMDCWQLIQHAFRLRGVPLSGDYIRCAYGPKRAFDTVIAGDFAHIGDGGRYPQPWDVVVIRNHEFLPTHLGLVIDQHLRFIQSVEGPGVSIQHLDAAEYVRPRRICGIVRLRESITIGDIVHLAAGDSPDMIVDRLSVDGISCSWNDGVNNVHQTFPDAGLLTKLPR